MADKSKHGKSGDHHGEISSLLRLPAGPVSIELLDPDATPGYPGRGAEDADELIAERGAKLADLHERLMANARITPDTTPTVLLVLQGMDTAGKSGVIRHVLCTVDPEGVHVTAFKVPTPQERAHDFLWRIGNAVPGPGMLGIFDRSQYEDVLVVRVEGLAPPEEVETRYARINAFEAELADRGVVVIKCFLNISPQEQRKRLLDRLKDPTKTWKYNPGDVDVRAKWTDYMKAYELALERCNTDANPWFVIPSDKEWYRNWAVAELLVEHLKALHLEWPVPPFDVAAEELRLA